jgi:hypothetical protein
MKIIEFKYLTTSLKQVVVNSLIITNNLKPDSTALIKFILSNRLYCAIENDKLLACSGYKNLRGNIRLAILKKLSLSDNGFIERVKTFTVKEKGWTYRHDSCPKNILDTINKKIDKQLSYNTLFSLIEKSNERMIKSSKSRGFNPIMEIKSPTSSRTLIVLYRP